jgi:DinB family protein
MRNETRRLDIELLTKAIDEAYNRSAWHGPNLRNSLRGVTAVEAAWRPGSGRHNIWEIVVHAAYWKYAVRRRLMGSKRGTFGERGSNWFGRRLSPNQKAWRHDLELLEQVHRGLREAIRTLDPNLLAKRLKGRPLSAHILGIAFHDVYHAGQIQLLKTLQRGGRRRPAN